MEIKWLRTALKNLKQEAEYIAKENPQAAQLLVQRILNSVSLLKDNPALGHSGRVPNTFELVIPNTRYIVPYRVFPRIEQIQILRVFHSSRKPPEHW